MRRDFNGWHPLDLFSSCDPSCDFFFFYQPVFLIIFSLIEEYILHSVVNRFIVVLISNYGLCVRIIFLKQNMLLPCLKTFNGSPFLIG